MSNVLGKLRPKRRGTDSSSSNFISLIGVLVEGKFDSLGGLSTSNTGKIIQKIIKTITCFKVF